MRRAEGERQRWKRVSLPHRRAGCCMRRCGGDGGGSWSCVDPPHRLPMPRPADLCKAGDHCVRLCTDVGYVIARATTWAFWANLGVFGLPVAYVFIENFFTQ
jgi:hypothetical protein